MNNEKQNKGSNIHAILSESQTVLFGFNLLFAVANIIILCIEFPRSQELSFDYIGAVIGVLAILVTVLVGWNVYSLIDIKHRSEIYEKNTQLLATLIGDVKFMESNSSAITEYSLFRVYWYLSGKDNTSLIYYMISHGLCTIEASMRTNNIDMAVQMTEELITLIRINEKSTITKQEKDEFFSTISRIIGTDRINKFNTLVEYIASIKTA